MSRMVVRFDGGAPTRRRVKRSDERRFDKSELLPNGFMRVDAVVTSPGVFIYHDENGNEVREYRPPSEVNRPDSVRSLRDATITMFHPDGLVTPANWKDVSIGHQSGDPVPTNEGIRTSLVVSDATGIKGVQNGDLVECSCGYELWLEDTSGITPEGEKFDRIQRDITYNHIALGPTNWGRQGPNVSLRLDSEGNQVAAIKQESKIMKIHIYFDGKLHEVEAGSQQHTELLNKIAAQKAEYDSAVAANATLKTALDTKTGELDVVTKERDKHKIALDAAPAAARSEVEARLRLEASAITVLGEEYKCDGKDDLAVRVDMIKSFDPEFVYNKDTHSKDYIRAVCDTHMKRGSGDRQLDMVRGAAGHEDPPVRRDAADDGEVDPEDLDCVEKAQARLRKDSKNAINHFTARKEVAVRN